MQPTPPASIEGWVYALVALFLTNAVTASIVNWIATRKKTSAETVQISAQSVRVEAEARQIATKTLIEAQNRIVELVEINSELRLELIEKARRSDNFEFSLGQANAKIEHLDDQIKLYEAQLDKYRGVEKLDQVLDKLAETVDKEPASG